MEAKPHRLYVSGLPPTTSEEDLKAKFSSFGTVTDIKISRGDRLLHADGVPNGKYL